MDELLQQLIANSGGDISKTDILNLLAIGLKENQSFAKYFADTVLVEITRKVKDLKIQSTAIEIDGKAISDKINQQIGDGIEGDIQKTVEKISSEVKKTADNISKESKNKDTLSVGSILGQTPQMSMFTQMKFQGLTRSIIDKIKSGLPEKIDISKDGVKLSDIFRPPSGKTEYLSLSLARFKNWDKLQNSILGKLTSSVADAKFSFKGEVGLSEVFRPPGSVATGIMSLSISRFKKWNSIQNSILDNLGKAASEVKFTFKNEVGMAEIFRPPGSVGNFLSMSMGRFKNWNNLQNTLIDKITKSVKKTTFTFQNEVGLSEVFRPPGDAVNVLSFSLSRFRNWNILQNTILQKLKAAASKTKFTFSGDVKLNDVFNASPEMGIFTKIAWTRLQLSLLSKARKSIQDVSISFKDKIDLNDIFSNTPEMGFFARMGWSRLQSSLLSKARKSVGDAKIGFKGDLSLNDIFGTTPEMGLLTKMSWGRLQRDIIKKIRDGLSSTETTKTGETKPKENKDVSIKPAKEFKSLEEKVPSIEVAYFSNEAIKQLSEMTGKDFKIIDNDKDDKKKSGLGLGVLGTLGLVGVGLLGGGLIGQITSIFSDGPFKGLQKAVSKMATHIGGFILEKVWPSLSKKFTGIISNMFESVGKVIGIFSKEAGEKVVSKGAGIATKLLKVGGGFLGKLLKKLPLIGSLISLGVAISRMIKGDFVGGLIDVASAVVGLVPVVGTALSIAIDLFSAKRDMETGGSAKAAGSAGNKWWANMVENLEDVPGIGTIIKISKGLGALFAGDWKKAGLYLAGSIPFLGPLFLDKGTMDKVGADPKKSIADVIKESFKQKIKTWFNWLPGWVKNPIFKLLGISSDESDEEPSSAKNKAPAEPPKDNKEENAKMEKADTDKPETISETVKSKDSTKPMSAEKSDKKEGNGITNALDLRKKIGDEQYNALLKSYAVSDSSRAYSAAQSKVNLLLEKGKEDEISKRLDDLKVNKKSANDFIWRRGQPIQPFNSKDNIISVKNENVFDKLINVLMGKQPEKTDNTAMQQISSDMKKLINKLTETNILMQNLAQSVAGSGQKKGAENLPPISDDAGTIRDPAYILRSRAWDRIRKGYVVL